MPAAADERLRAAAAWLRWQEAAGVDVTLAEPGDVGAAAPSPAPSACVPAAPAPAPPAAAVPPGVPRAEAASPPRPPSSPTPAVARVRDVQHEIADARRIAAACRSLEELRAALEGFEACPLAATATQLCFADGHPQAPLFLVGEAPGAAEDRLGKPFVGPSGQLLDRMLAAIGLDRSRVWITNTVFWRPPGNRPPTAAEIAMCLPFLERQIALVRPKVLLFLGGLAARVLLGMDEGVTRLRGREFVYRGDDLPHALPAFVTYHPAYLLRQPAQKRFAWRDLLAVAARLEDAAVG